MNRAFSLVGADLELFDDAGLAAKLSVHFDLTGAKELARATALRAGAGDLPGASDAVRRAFLCIARGGLGVLAALLATELGLCSALASEGLFTTVAALGAFGRCRPDRLNSINGTDYVVRALLGFLQGRAALAGDLTLGEDNTGSGVDTSKAGNRHVEGAAGLGATAPEAPRRDLAVSWAGLGVAG